jgi:hypothetical protein
LTEFPNPVFRSVLLRDVAPFLPVWVFGLLVAVLLDTYGLGGPRLSISRLDSFVAIYSVLVLALLGLFIYRHYQSSPTRIEIGADYVRGWVPRRASDVSGSGGMVEFPFPRVVGLSGGGFFGPRVLARDIPRGRSSRSIRTFDWLHLTPENAERVAAALRSWRARQPDLP